MNEFDVILWFLDEMLLNIDKNPKQQIKMLKEFVLTWMKSKKNS